MLFRGTVWENIAYGSRTATDEQIAQAAQAARLDEFVPHLANGYQTEVGDNGCLLSAGQRQRVALARAILADPTIFILDEATSQMDGHTESLVHDSLTEFLKGRTTFIITHRQSSLELADRIVVMEHGQIVYDSPTDTAYQEATEFQFLFAKSA